MSSVTFFELANILLVSARTESGVAVKLGGACGGFLNPMAEVLRGLQGAAAEVTGLKGRTWFSMEPNREGARKGARMTRQTMVKRVAEVRRRRVAFLIRARMPNFHETIKTWTKGERERIESVRPRGAKDGLRVVGRCLVQGRVGAGLSVGRRLDGHVPRLFSSPLVVRLSSWCYSLSGSGDDA